MPLDSDNIGKLYTIFSDLTLKDISSQLYIVCKIIRIGRIILSEKENSANLEENTKIYQSFRRPFGYAILDMTEFLKDYETGIEKEFTVHFGFHDRCLFTLH